MAINIIEQLNSEKNILNKTLTSMEYFTETLEYKNITDEEHDLITDHMESIILLIEKIDARIEYYNNKS